jgi:hypothetical protein
MDEQTATVLYDPEKFTPESAMESFTGRFRLSIPENDD